MLFNFLYKMVLPRGDMEVIGSSLAVLWPKFAYCMCTYRVAKGSKGMLHPDL